ncbi:hypothetical protein Hanom_Chr11g01010841 [Helianthus anomalus]
MMEDKFGRKKLDIFGNTDSEDNGDDGDDEGGEGGDGGNVGASAASTRGGGDVDSSSDDNPPEPGYEHYIDDRGIRQLRRIRTDQDQDEDYVPSDTEAADLGKNKQSAIRRKKKMKKTVGTSSSAHASIQQETVAEPVQEAEVNPQFPFTAKEAFTPDEKVEFLFSQLQVNIGQINRHSDFMSANRNTILKQQLEINTLKETAGKQQAEIAQLHAENERLKAADDERERQLKQMQAADNVHGIDMNRLKERSTDVLQTANKLSGQYDEITKWYGSRNKVIADNVKQMTSSYEVTRKRVNILWADKCKAEEVLHKRDHDSEDQGNPDIYQALLRHKGNLLQLKSSCISLSSL